MAQIEHKIVCELTDVLCRAALNMRDANGLLIQPSVINPHVIYQIAMTAITTVMGSPVYVAGGDPNGYGQEFRFHEIKDK